METTIITLLLYFHLRCINSFTVPVFVTESTLFSEVALTESSILKHHGTLKIIQDRQMDSSSEEDDFSRNTSASTSINTITANETTTTSTVLTTTATRRTKPPIHKPNITCPSEKFHDLGLYFKETPASTWAVPSKLCLQHDYTPVRRYCFENGTWDKIQGNCSDSVSLTNTTSKLYGIMSMDAVELDQTLKVIDSETFKTDLQPVDVYFISRILDRASENENIVQYTDNFTAIVDRIMGEEKELLQSSQRLLNSTDTILYNLDKLLLKGATSKSVSLPSLLVHTVNMTEEGIGIIGGMIRNTSKDDSFTGFEVVPLYELNYTKQLETTDFEIAFQVPESFIKSHYYYITLFYNDNFFNPETNDTGLTVGSWIISILIPDASTFDSMIKIYFKEFTENSQRQCNHWRYGKDEENVSIKGRWSSDNEVIKFREGIYICEINHTTHFGMLVSNSIADNFFLDFLTIFGSVLSIVGIAIIFLTALFFKNWRHNPSNKIILNVALCLLLLIVLFFLSDLVNEGASCITVGILLHYMILAQFCWMLAISYSNFRRLRLSLHYHIENVVLKYCVICWGLPLIIVAIVAGISAQTYNKIPDEKSSLCYPKDNYFKLGLLLPMGIILFVNLIVYILILTTITSTNFDLRKHSLSKSYSKQKSMILLFFMMGMTWIFGFLVAFTDIILFAFLFCTTATCQGFIIFLFYILDATNTKELWKNKMQKLLKIKMKPKEGTLSETTQTQSTTE